MRNIYISLCIYSARVAFEKETQFIVGWLRLVDWFALSGTFSSARGLIWIFTCSQSGSASKVVQDLCWFIHVGYFLISNQQPFYRIKLSLIKPRYALIGRHYSLIVFSTFFNLLFLSRTQWTRISWPIIT